MVSDTQTCVVIVDPDPHAEDCLVAAVEAYVTAHPELEGWALEVDWVDDSDRIAITVPSWTVTPSRESLIEQVRARVGEDEYVDVGDVVNMLLACNPSLTVAEIVMCMRNGRDCAETAEREAMVAAGLSELN